MPIYEYVCNDCQARYEKLVLGNGDATACPECGSRKATLQFSTFSTAGRSSAANDAAPAACTPKSCGCH
jgi:putative FmdB family regulatory protein